MIPIVLLGLVGAASGLASPLAPRQNASNATGSTARTAPSVTIYPPTQDGNPVTLTGTRALGIDKYLGLPFASPPVDDLRFVAPQTAVWNSSEFNATVQPPACTQAQSAIYGAYGISEDCLYLNVHTPAGANATNAYLPVVVWVYGGSFTSGAASFYDPTILMSQASSSDRPIVFVALNYRLGAFGFLYGDEAADNSAGNLGLRDVQMGLEWVQQHIWAFGGNPDQVTVAGQSAGAILISLLYLQPELNLFKSAIMESGAQSTAPIGPTGSTWQGAYDALVNFAGCNLSGNSTTANATSAANSTSAGNSTSSFECLKSLPAAQLFAAQQRVSTVPQYSAGFIFAPSIDGDLVPDSPHKLLEQGQFAKIPFISGNNKDEGTIFVPTTLPDNETIAAISFASLEPGGLSKDVLTQLFGQVYPNVPSLGSPYDTGNNTFGLSPVFKQASAIVGDASFQANRRWFLRQSTAQDFDQTWSYLFEATLPSLPPQMGSYHGLEIFYVFGLPQLAQLNVTGIPGAAALGALAARYNFTSVDVTLAQQMANYWLNFAYYTDPNGDSSTGNATYWPKYGSELNMLSLDQSNISVISDTYRKEQMEFFLERPNDFNYKRSVAV